MLRPIRFAAALALSAGAAIAADLPASLAPPPIVRAPFADMTEPTPIAFNWSGFYFGAHAGYGFGESPFVDGAAFGGQVGVNWQYQGFVIGAEGDGAWVDWAGANSVGSARLRGGLAFDRFFLYATGGAAFKSFDDVGWVAGTGLEYAFTKHWTVGAEYLYVEFNRGASDLFRARANYLFGGLAGVPAMTSPTPIAYDWSGFAFGAHGGWGLVNGVGLTDGREVGLQVGVNEQFGRFVVGMETEGGFVDWGPGHHGVGSVRGRLGYAFNRLLPYISGGMGIEDSVGWTVGAGTDYALTDHWSVGVEYLHHDFRGGDEADIFRGRVNYLFNTVSGV